MTSLWCRVNGPCTDELACRVGARTLWTAWTHAEERFSRAMGVLVRKGGMGGVGGTEYAAERRGLGAGQGAHRGDGRGGTVLMNRPLRLNRTLLTGPEERSVGYMVLKLDCFSFISHKLYSKREHPDIMY